MGLWLDGLTRVSSYPRQVREKERAVQHSKLIARRQNRETSYYVQGVPDQRYI